jgi:hypothetical protein
MKDTTPAMAVWGVKTGRDENYDWLFCTACPTWVIRVDSAVSSDSPLYPQYSPWKRTSLIGSSVPTSDLSAINDAHATCRIRGPRASDVSRGQPRPGAGAERLVPASPVSAVMRA